MEINYEIDLNDFLHYLIKKRTIIVLSAILFSVLALGYAFFTTKTYHCAQASLLIESENTNVPVEQMNILTRVDIVEQALHSSSSNISTTEAISNTSLARYRFSNELMITYKCVEDKANTYLKYVIGRSIEVINNVQGYSVKLGTSSHSINDCTVGPSKAKLGLLGFMGGVVLAVFFIALKYVFENKIRSVSFIENVLGYNVIATTDLDALDYSEVYANIVYTYPKTKVISIINLSEKDNDIGMNIAKTFLHYNDQTLCILEDDGDSVDKFVIEKTEQGLSVVRYDESEYCKNIILNKSGKLINEHKDKYDYVLVCLSLESLQSYNVVFNSISDGTVIIMKKDDTSIKDAVSYKKVLDNIGANVIGVVFVTSK